MMRPSAGDVNQLYATSKHSFAWCSPPHSLTLQKSPTGGLGIKIYNFSHETGQGLDYITIVNEIKPECTIQDPNRLAKNDRIISVEGKSITDCTYEKVYEILKSHTEKHITLEVVRVVQVPDSSNHTQTNTDVSVPANKTAGKPTKPVANLQRLFSGNSNDSGRGCSPKSGDPEGNFIFHKPQQNGVCPTSDLSHSGIVHNNHSSEVIVNRLENNADFQTGNVITQGGAKSKTVLGRSGSGCSGGSSKSQTSAKTPRCDGHILAGHHRHVTNPKIRSGHLCQNHCAPLLHVPVVPSSQLSQPFGCAHVQPIQTPNHLPLRVPVAVNTLNPSPCSCPHRFALPATPVFGKQFLERVASVPEGCSPNDLLMLDTRDRCSSLPLPIQGSENQINNCLSPPHCQVSHSGMAFDNALGNKVPLTKPPKNCSRVQPTDAIAEARVRSNSIGQQILKSPENVIWTDTTKLCLEKCGKKMDYGLSLTSRQCVNKDGSTDVYTLVEQVKRGGLADGKLFVGDLICSVNGHPVHQAREEGKSAQPGVNKALGLMKDLEKMETVTFVFQRPLRMKGVNTDNKKILLKEKSSKHGSYYPSSKHNSKAFSTSPDFQEQNQIWNGFDPQVERSQRLMSHTKKPPKMERYMSRSSNGSNGSGKQHSPPVNAGSSPTINFSRSISASCEPFDVVGRAKNWAIMDTVVKFPSMQLFLVGSHAVSMCEQLLTVSPGSFKGHSKDKFLSLRCIVQEDSEGFTRLSLPDGKSVCDNDLLSGVMQQFVDCESGICEDDIQFDITTQCGSESSSRCFSRMTSRTSHSTSSVVGLDIYIITDDKYFCHCCPAMFSKNSFFFLTFDGTRVLESTSEMTKVGQMVHAVRANSDAPLYELYGFLDADGGDNQNSKIDELKALFYTDQILKYTNMIMPHFVSSQQPIAGTSYDRFCEARQTIGQIVLKQDSFTGHLHLATISIMSWIYQQRSQGRIILELGELLERITSLVPELQGIHVTKIVEELENTSTILLSGHLADTTLPESVHQKVLIQPAYLLQGVQACLQGLEKTSNTSKNSPREATHLQYPTAATKVMLERAFETSQLAKIRFEDLFPFLLKFQILQQVWDVPDLYWVMYYLPEPQSDWETPNPSSQSEHFTLYVKLGKVISVGRFLKFVQTLACICEAEGFSVSHCTAQMQLQQDWVVSLGHLWKDDLFKISLRSEKSNSPNSPPCGFIDHLLQTIQSCLPSTLEIKLCVPCPLRGECEFEGKHPHLLNIFEEGPSFCGNTRLDNKKEVKQWNSALTNKDLLARVRTQCQGADPPGGDPPGSDPPSPREKSGWTTPLMKLPYSLLSQLYRELNVPMHRYNDWRGFAGCLNKTDREVKILEHTQNPTRELIVDWAKCHRVTVRDLVEILNKPEMERHDLVEIIQQSLQLS